MPAKSEKQMRFMRAVASGALKKGIGPSKEVAEEFISKTSKEKRKLFNKKKNG